MVLFWLIPGLILPATSGWCLVRLLEGNTPVLRRTERWILGGATGLLLSGYLVFLANVTDLVSLSFGGFLTVFLLLLAVTGGLWYRKRQSFGSKQPPLAPAKTLWPLWLRILAAVLAGWVALKLLAGLFMLLGTPAYFDDVLNNWNFRGKVYFVARDIVLGITPNESGGTFSYPQAVPLIKTWLSTLAGQWNEALVNSVHALWYLAVSGCVYFSLRRLAGIAWSLLGVYLLTSMPLYLMHGVTPYADVFLSLHILLPVLLLFHAVREEDNDRRAGFLRLSAFTAGLVIYTKNEALLLYLPPLLVLAALSLWWLTRTKRMSPTRALIAAAWYAGWCAAVGIPWLSYKWMNGLAFGNAKAVSDFSIGWQEGVPTAIAVNTFFEANWNLFFVLFIGVLLWQWRRWLSSPLLIPVLFFLVVYFAQMPLFLFTEELGHEALMQTGYARGLVHLLPVAVFSGVVLLKEAFD